MIISVRIRKAAIGDLATMVEFNAQLAQETEAFALDRNLARRGIQDVLADPSKGIYWLAEVNGAVVGQVLLTAEWNDWRDGFFWWIQGVFIKKEWRGRGVFHALFEFVHEQAAEHPEVCGVRLCVDVQNNRAKRVCESLGMEPKHHEVYEMDFRKIEFQSAERSSEASHLSLGP